MAPDWAIVVVVAAVAVALLLISVADILAVVANGSNAAADCDVAIEQFLQRCRCR